MKPTPTDINVTPNNTFQGDTVFWINKFGTSEANFRGFHVGGHSDKVALITASGMQISAPSKEVYTSKLSD